MTGNIFGHSFRVAAFGESHGIALGCVVDGCPAQVPLSLEDIRRELRRRRPGGGGPATTRVEEDEPEILSGVFQGKTLGTPIAIIVRNTNQRSGDYEALKDTYRPGHADWTWEAKYGFRDYRGGGRSSGRETLSRVASGAVAKAFLSMYGITIQAWTAEAAGVKAPRPGEEGYNIEEIEKNALRMPNGESAAEALSKLERIRGEEDSAGGIVACQVLNLPPGLGEPVFGKVDALLAGAMLSLGAAKGVEFGAGFAAAKSRGSLQNDPPLPRGEWRPSLPRHVPDMDFETNNAGGVLGGMSSGAALEFNVAFKPVPSISTPQKTLDREGKPRELIVQGRHDLCLCPRAVPVVEAMAALVLADLLLQNRSARV